MVVIAPGAKAIERWRRVPKEVAITEATPRFDVGRNPKLRAGLLPERCQTVGCRIARPGPAFTEDFHLNGAEITIHQTSHLPRPGQRQQRCLGARIYVRREGAKFTFRHGFMRHAVQDRSAGYSGGVEG